MHLWAWGTQAAPRAACQSEVVASMPIGTSHVRSTSCRVFPSPPYVDFYAGRWASTRDPRSIGRRVPSCRSTYAGAWRNAMRGWGDVASANRHGCNHLRLARAPRRGLLGPTSAVPPANYASRAVRHIPVSCSVKPRPCPPRSVEPRVVFFPSPAVTPVATRPPGAEVRGAGIMIGGGTTLALESWVL